MRTGRRGETAVPDDRTPCRPFRSNVCSSDRFNLSGGGWGVNPITRRCERGFRLVSVGTVCAGMMGDMGYPAASWLSPEVEVRRSGIEGFGLFAVRGLSAGTVVE